MHKWQKHLRPIHDRSESITRIRPPQSGTKMTSRTAWDASSSSLRNKLHALSQLKDKISERESCLDTLYRERGQLEREIAELQNRCLSINQLPVDAISHIFDYVIVLNPNVSCGIHEAASDRIALMRTCKRWRKIIIDSPLLWNTIYIKPLDHDVDPARWIKRFYLYLHQCILHSQEVAMDLVLDLKLLTNGYVYVGNQISSSLSSFCRPGELAEWSNNIDEEACPAATAYDELFKTLVDDILGPDGFFVRRLHQLYLTLPEATITCQLYWNMMTNLVSQSQTVVGQDSILPPSQVSVASAIRQLVISSAVLEDLPLMSHLHTLKIKLSYDWRGSEVLNGFYNLPALQSLTIMVVGPLDQEVYESLDLSPVKIPHLRLLELRGPIPSKIIQMFELQRLEQLTIVETLYGYEMYEKFPQAQLFGIVEKVVCQGLTPRPKTVMKPVLSTLFVQLMKVHTIIVPQHANEDAVTMVRACRALGALPLIHEIRILESEQDSE